MTTRTFCWLASLVALMAFGLPLLGHWARSTPEVTCALDGVAVDPLMRVRVVDDQGKEHLFCCIRCATLWLNGEGTRPRQIFVTDEVSGREIDAAAAWFVRSRVVTVPHTGNRLHAFATWADATRHVHTGHGVILADADCPFPWVRRHDIPSGR
jgi:hypothetical protein